MDIGMLRADLCLLDPCHSKREVHLPKSCSTCTPRALRSGLLAGFMGRISGEECFIPEVSEGEAMGTTSMGVFKRGTYSCQSKVNVIRNCFQKE